MLEELLPQEGLHSQYQTSLQMTVPSTFAKLISSQASIVGYITTLLFTWLVSNYH